MYYGDTTGERIRKLREDKGERQQDVANAILSDRTYISFIESNKRNPDIEKLIALANHFDVTTDFLLCRSNVKKPDTNMQAVSEYIGLSDESVKKIVSLKGGTNYLNILDEFICSSSFLEALSILDISVMRISKINKDIKRNEDIIEIITNRIEEQKTKGQEETNGYYGQLMNLECEKGAFEISKEEQKDICAVKMIKVVRNFLDR